MVRHYYSHIHATGCQDYTKPCILKIISELKADPDLQTRRILMQAPTGIPGPVPPSFSPPQMTQLSPIARPFFPQFQSLAATKPRPPQTGPPSIAGQLPPTKTQPLRPKPPAATGQLPQGPSQPSPNSQSPVSKFKQQLVSTRPAATTTTPPLPWRAATVDKEQRGQNATAIRPATSTAAPPPLPWRAAESQEQRGAAKGSPADGRASVAAQQSSGAGGLQFGAKDAGKAVPGGSKSPPFVGHRVPFTPLWRRERW